MKISVKIALMLLLLSVAPGEGKAQCIDDTSECGKGVPHFVKFDGILKSALNPSQRGSVPIKFTIYGDSTSGSPLWQEVQNVQVDSQGRYEVVLGSTSSDGIPIGLFTVGEPRWVGVQALLPGLDEQPKVLMVSVPYAVEAKNAQTLGGLPASAFMKAGSNTSSGAVSSTQIIGTRPSAEIPVENAGSVPPIATPAIEGRVGPVNVIPKFSGAGLASSQMTDSGGTVSLQDLANILFADRFADVASAVDSCPASGCIIYALSPSVNLNLGMIDPGTKAITIYLGPYTYTVKQITLRKSLKIIGMGATGGVVGTTTTCSPAAPCSGTALQSINGNNPVFVLPQTNNAPSTNVLLTGFRVLGSAGNTNQDGFFLDTSSSVNSGLWYSTFHDVYLAGFAGIAIHMKGRNGDFLSATQWILFNNVVVSRTRGGGNALRMEGAVFELRFTNCQFDGQAIGDGTNIYLGGRPGGSGGYPTSIVFEGLVSQQAALAMQIDGGVNVTLYGAHHEQLWGGYQITNNTNIGTRGLVISESYFAGNVGVNAGSGYELNITTTAASGIVFAHNQMFGNPDAIITGTNFSSVVYQDNLYSGAFNVPPTSGITSQVNPAASINLAGVHSVGLNSSSTPITTIQSSLGPGEMVTLFTFVGPVTFASGGNIDLMGASTLMVNGSITFMRNDLLGNLQWIPVSQWGPGAASPPTAATR